MANIFIHRRDLRLFDNVGLSESLKNGETHCCFIIDPRQFSEKNEYLSLNARQFLIESLMDLNKQLSGLGSCLNIFFGKFEEVCKKLSEKHKLYVNSDYTPFSKNRDSLCKLNISHDYYLNVPGTILTGQGTPYTVFTPFKKKSMLNVPSKPKNSDFNNLSKVRLVGSSNVNEINSDYFNPDLWVNGGRSLGLKLLQDTLSKCKNYNFERNFPSLNSTSSLSAHLKFGTLSCREVYYFIKENLGLNNNLINELYWRDFYMHVMFHYPRVIGNNFLKKYDSVEWPGKPEHFIAWCEGKTGFPIIDAGMRQLNKTGWMHNRVRMIVASFLTKSLHVDWRLGEKYFAQKLVDYDIASNNGGWQWAASTGTDAQPYFRIFNPWTQQQKFDPDCLYIKKYVPELKDFSVKEIHSIEKVPLNVSNYVPPIIDHSQERLLTLDLFKH